MSESNVLVPLTLRDISQVDRFRTLELQSARDRRITAEEMIDTLLAERCCIEASARAAETAYGTPFDFSVVRRCAVLQNAAEFLGLVHQHRNEVLPIIMPAAMPAAKRRRA